MQLRMRKPCDYLYSPLNQKEAIFHSPLFLALVFSILLSIIYNKILEHLETRENKE